MVVARGSRWGKWGVTNQWAKQDKYVLEIYIALYLESTEPYCMLKNLNG